MNMNEREKIGCGSPQGSYLGLLLFIIYVNDCEHYLQGATPNMYVADTSTTYTSTNRAFLQRNKDIDGQCRGMGEGKQA